MRLQKCHVTLKSNRTTMKKYKVIFFKNKYTNHVVNIDFFWGPQWRNDTLDFYQKTWKVYPGDFKGSIYSSYQLLAAGDDEGYQEFVEFNKTIESSENFDLFER